MDVIEGYRQRALEDLEQMQLLAGSRFFLGAVSRAYYACFHAMKYRLEQEGAQTKSHKQTQVEFRQRFIRNGPFTKSDSALIDQLFVLRQSSDYDPIFAIDEATCQALLARTIQFVRTVCEAG